MQAVTTIIFTLLIVPSLSMGGEIFGNIKDKNIPEELTKEAEVEVKCGDSTYKVKSVVPGTYSLSVLEKGKCKLTVYYEQQDPSMDVNSQANAVRYDLMLDKTGQTYNVKRQ